MSLDKRPLVSFVVPCYNYGHYLSDCLNSIFSQEKEDDFEVIVIDDASTDNTQEILRNFSDSRLNIVTHPKNQGHAKTINEGLSLAKGSYIARIDPDDRYRSCFLYVTLDKFRHSPELGLVYGDAAVINEKGEITVVHCDKSHKGLDFKGNEFLPLLENNFICAPTVIARRETWQRVLPVPQWLAFNDWYFTLMMARENDFYYVNQVIAEYRVHADNFHTRIARDKSEEISIFWLLNKVFSESEKNRELEHGKRGLKKKIYAQHYLASAEKYFWFQLNSDARRCYLLAMYYRPQLIFRLDVLRRALAVLICRDAYEYFKMVIKHSL